MSVSENVAAGSDAAFDDVELVGERRLTWFDVSTIGSGEFLAMLTWGFIVYIASVYGLKWGIVGFVIAAAVMFVPGGSTAR